MCAAVSCLVLPAWPACTCTQARSSAPVAVRGKPGFVMYTYRDPPTLFDDRPTMYHSAPARAPEAKSARPDSLSGPHWAVFALQPRKPGVRQVTPVPWYAALRAPPTAAWFTSSCQSTLLWLLPSGAMRTAPACVFAGEDVVE